MHNLNTPRGVFETAQDAVVSWVEDLGAVRKMVFETRVELITIRGTIRGTDQSATMLYVGRGRNLAYLRGKALVDPKVVATQTASLFSYKAAMTKLEDQADFTFVDIGLPYQSRVNRDGGFLVLPDWVNMVIPINGDWDQVESGFNKTTRKLIRRNPYTFELSRDPGVISRFYDEFYLPYLTLRHEDPTVESRKAVERRARQGGILRVIGEDGPVVAGVVYPEDGVLYYLWLGMPERYLHDQPEGALFASYYFCLRYAYENGFDAANWMGTRSFPKDGIFQFKRKWGAHVSDRFSPDAILFRPKAGSRQAAAFAEGFPLIARRDGKLEQIFCTTADTLTEADAKRVISGYDCPGIDQITIVHICEDGAAHGVTQSEAQPNLRIVKTDLTRFADFYARDEVPV